ncbi:hypothetical protein BB559_000180 [Furculomyces boomerangus]|uniref:Uncharacterized protein n=2 Tax=Harpellales TaxID=61421 RepID=A0A2T9XYV5_9FUNG|nr:hypothetical protein BB559_007106 [Furculomyces boomerangus]PVV00037.1 hypothetical protein BB559_000180 [Furculomyces boomerangus]PVZ97930.1 hypothetical protein BB558_006093 [Smittium angustum]PWA01827.1 hypothetical protein BB558_002066 [Smittium angustum]
MTAGDISRVERVKIRGLETDPKFISLEIGSERAIRLYRTQRLYSKWTPVVFVFSATFITGTIFLFNEANRERSRGIVEKLEKANYSFFSSVPASNREEWKMIKQKYYTLLLEKWPSNEMWMGLGKGYKLRSSWTPPHREDPRSYKNGVKEAWNSSVIEFYKYLESK